MMTEESKGTTELPPELWVEILLRLPAKPLVRFKCVSKIWRSVINDPKFTHKHLSLWKHGPPSRKKMVLSWESGDSDAPPQRAYKFMLRTMDEFRYVEEIMTFPSDKTPQEFAYQPISYADGLVLIQRKRWSPKSSEYILYNHSIRKVVVLPPPPHCNFGWFHFLLGLDPLNNEHKVFMICIPFSARGGSFVTFAYYTLSTGCWSSARTIEENHYSWDKLLGPSLYAKGAIHWLYIERTTEDPVYTHVLSFDIATEALSLTSLPGDHKSVRIPVLVHDAFAIFHISGGSACIWILEQCGESKIYSWSKWYQRPTDYTIHMRYSPYMGIAGGYAPILYSDKGKILVVSTLEARDETDDVDEIEDEIGDDIGDDIECYDVESGMVEDLQMSPPGFVLNLMGPYAESLLLANASSDHTGQPSPRRVGTDYSIPMHFTD